MNITSLLNLLNLHTPFTKSNINKDLNIFIQTLCFIYLQHFRINPRPNLHSFYHKKYISDYLNEAAVQIDIASTRCFFNSELCWSSDILAILPYTWIADGDFSFKLTIFHSVCMSVCLSLCLYLSISFLWAWCTFFPQVNC